ncbi:hypothetical protein KPL70_005591 [Citrus sinensis]|nr:hypothetical protein KPL70_005591 [Citrus sinensis]
MIQPERGPRQGCPLSPYLFIICDDAFSNLLVKAEKNQLIRGLKFAKEVSITHLLFADDSLVFSRALVADCKHLKEIFDIYTVASGQIFNFQKSSLFISGQIPASQAAAIKDIFKLNMVSKHEKYLGLPSMIGRKKLSFFNEVKLKVLNKIVRWQHRMFSSGGKEILIKAAAQAIPAYAMSVFKIPRGLCDDIQRAIATFWWGAKEDKQGIHWLKWEKLNHAKSRGKKIAPNISTANAESVLDAFQRVRKIDHSHIAYSSGEKLQKWIPPPENVFKVNVEATINVQNQTTRVGAVIRGTNDKGMPILISLAFTEMIVATQLQLLD